MAQNIKDELDGNALPAPKLHKGCHFHDPWSPSPFLFLFFLFFLAGEVNPFSREDMAAVVWTGEDIAV